MDSCQMNLEEKKHIVQSIRKEIGYICRDHGFKKSKKSYWVRRIGDSIQAIRLDHRVVGKYPYYIEIGIDFVSIGAHPDKTFSAFPVRIDVARMVSNSAMLLNVLSPEYCCLDLSVRLNHVKDFFVNVIFSKIDKVYDICSIKLLVDKYTFPNTITVARVVSQLF